MNSMPIMKAGRLDQVPEHQVPGVQGAAERDVRRPRHDGAVPGEGAQEEMLASGQWIIRSGKCDAERRKN